MMLEKFRAARRAGAPIVAIQTADPTATMLTIVRSAIAAAKNNNTEPPPLILWDCVNGWKELNDAGKAAINKVCEEGLKTMTLTMLTSNGIESLRLARNLPPGTMIFYANAHRFLPAVDITGSPMMAAFAQAVWNVRDLYKQSKRVLVLLGPSFKFPPEIANDVLLIDEALPADDEIAAIVKRIPAANNFPEVSDDQVASATDALRGLSAFSVEQAAALCITKDDGYNIDQLWETKRRMIDQTPGLSVWREPTRFDQIGGVEQIKKFLRALLNGKQPPRVVVFIDEIEKAISGATGPVGDSSGVSQGFLGTLLQYMQDEHSRGLLFIGPPGAAKSQVAKSIGAEAGIPTVALDLGRMKASLVGESESRLRQALKVITSVGGGRVLFVATCNRVATLPPELRRRFKRGAFFFDLPTKQEREIIWDLYFKKYGVENLRAELSEINDDGWTGAEIEQAVEMAWEMDMPLAEASKYVVPVSRSAAEEIERLRQNASGRYLSASHPGVYQQRYETSSEDILTTGRTINDL